MKIIKGLFFDLDGTIADTIEANFRAYHHVLDELGRPFTRDMYIAIHGMRVDKFLRQYFPDITQAEIDEVRRLKTEVFPDYAHLARPNQQLVDFIRTVQPQHITALVTTAQRPNAETMLKVLGLEDLFAFRVTGDEVVQPKPDPEAYLLALQRTGLSADEVLAFEDSQHGLEAATAAGISALTITIPEETK